MDAVALGGIGLLALLVMLLLRVPVAAAVLSVAVIGLGVTGLQRGEALSPLLAELGNLATDLLSPDVAAVVILFVALDNIAFYAGISTRIYDAATVWLRHMPGGLAVASVLGCGGFASFSGSSVGCAATMGRICVPEMQKQGYDIRLATASVAMGGTVGSLIPPSVLFMLFGFLSGVPVGALFLAGILPGLLSLAVMIGVIFWWKYEDPRVVPAATAKSPARAEASLALLPPVILMMVLIAGLVSGLLELWQTGLLCVVTALAFGTWHGRINAGIVRVMLREIVSQSASILLVVAAAKLLLGFSAATGIGTFLAQFVSDLQFPALTVIAIAAFIYLLMGMFIEPVGILALTLPVMLPLAGVYGMDLIWLGVIIVKLLEIALVTPPVGLNVFVISGVVPNVPAEKIFEGVARFLTVDVLVLVILILFPAIATSLPGIAMP